MVAQIKKVESTYTVLNFKAKVMVIAHRLFKTGLYKWSWCLKMAWKRYKAVKAIMEGAKVECFNNDGLFTKAIRPAFFLGGFSSAPHIIRYYCNGVHQLDLRTVNAFRPLLSI